MDKLLFVDKDLCPIGSLFSDRSIISAIDLGVCTTFAGRNLPAEKHHFFVSSEPWIKNVDRKSAYLYLNKLRDANPEVEFGLLHIKQIYELNKIGEFSLFKIDNCWSSGTYDDEHGRTEGYYAIKNGAEIIDNGQTKTDVYYVFGFTPGQERKILLP